MNKKSEKIKEFKPLPIIIILIIIFGAAVYIFIKNNLTKSNASFDDSNNKAKDVIDIKDVDSDLLFQIFFDILGNDEKSKIDSKNITDDQFIAITTSFITTDDYENYDPNGGKFEMGSYDIPLSLLQNIAKKYFNKDFKNFETIIINGDSCTLKNTTYKCIQAPTGVESLDVEITSFVPVDVTVKNNKLTISGVKVHETLNALYTSETKNNKLCDISEITSDLILDQKKECVINNTDSLKKVSLTFIINDGHYIFESLTK